MTYELYPLDCRQAMRLCLAENSIDSIVTDPPYDLTSIVKRFGGANAAPAQHGTDGAFARLSGGFMGKIWDGTGVAFDPDTWREAYRVLKPGGYLLAFGGSRTYHRLACAIEDAGFEIRDQIMWIYGSGFPKSLDVSKAIDKASLGSQGRFGVSNFSEIPEITAPATDAAREWAGWGTALKPAHEPIVVARKPLVGTVAQNMQTWGTGAINIEASRIGDTGGTARASNPVNMGRSDMSDFTRGNFGINDIGKGRFPANVIHDGSDEVLAAFPAQAGASARASGPTHEGISKSGSMAGYMNGMGDREPAFYGDSGSAARFFYCAKASKSDRNEGCEGLSTNTAGMRSNNSDQHITRRDEGYVPPSVANTHPTVKPTDLMRYLVRMVTPPGGTVLDPFTGSGSTGKAAILEGFSFIGCEMTAEYIPIAMARLDHAVTMRYAANHDG